MSATDNAELARRRMVYHQDENGGELSGPELMGDRLNLVAEWRAKQDDLRTERGEAELWQRIAARKQARAMGSPAVCARCDGPLVIEGERFGRGAHGLECVFCLEDAA